MFKARFTNRWSRKYTPQTHSRLHSKEKFTLFIFLTLAEQDESFDEDEFESEHDPSDETEKEVDLKRNKKDAILPEPKENTPNPEIKVPIKPGKEEVKVPNSRQLKNIY